MAKKTAKLSTIIISATVLRKSEYESTLRWNQRSTAKGKVNCNPAELRVCCTKLNKVWKENSRIVA